MTALLESSHPGEVIVSLASGFRSVDKVTIDNSQTITAGTVIGRSTSESAGVTVGTPVNAGTGNGVCTKASPAYSAEVMEGTYVIRITTAVTNLGDFEVIRPDGTVDGAGKVGTAYDGQVKFTVADGSTDFVVGDTISIKVDLTTAAYTWGAHNPDSTAGYEIARGIALWPATTAADTHKAIAAIVRDAEVRSSELVWAHSGITAAEKAKAIDDLARLSGIIVRT